MATRLSKAGRSLLFLLAGVGLGLAVGVSLPPIAPPAGSPPTSAPTPPTDTRSAPARVASATTPRREPAAPAPRATRAPAPAERAALESTLAITTHELRQLARSLSEPSDYRTVRAVVSDLQALNEARARRARIGLRLGRPLPAIGAPLPRRLIERLEDYAARDVLALEVTDAPPGVRYVGDLHGPGWGAVELQNTSGARCVRWRSVDSGRELQVEVREDAPEGRDLLITRLARDGREQLVHEARLPGPAGRTFAWLLQRLFDTGTVTHAALSALRARVRPPERSFLDWVRRHVGLPADPTRGERPGAPPPLPAADPLLLGGATPTLLDRPDLILAPTRTDVPVLVGGPEPQRRPAGTSNGLSPAPQRRPIAAPARGPLVVLARNGVALHHQRRWQWLAFDPGALRVVQRTPEQAWTFTPDLGLDPARAKQRFDAVTERIGARVRQALSLLALRREVRALESDLAAKVGGLYSRDGLEAMRLREGILARRRRIQTLAHLLLDRAGGRAADRALRRAERETTARVVDVLLGMIEAGRSGPVEYLLREESVKTLLFAAPQAYRLRLVSAFQRRFRPLSTRIRLSIVGHNPRWYESVRWFQED